MAASQQPQHLRPPTTSAAAPQVSCSSGPTEERRAIGFIGRGLLGGDMVAWAGNESAGVEKSQLIAHTKLLRQRRFRSIF
jgi:hypothetical protein